MNNNDSPKYIVQVFSNGQWRKRRGPEGGPWNTLDRAERMALGCERAPRKTSSSDGKPHRAVEVSS